METREVTMRMKCSRTAANVRTSVRQNNSTTQLMRTYSGTMGPRSDCISQLPLYYLRYPYLYYRNRLKCPRMQISHRWKWRNSDFNTDQTCFVFSFWTFYSISGIECLMLILISEEDERCLSFADCHLICGYSIKSI